MRRLQRNERFRKISLLDQLSQVDSEDLSYVAICPATVYKANLQEPLTMDLAQSEIKHGQN